MLQKQECLNHYPFLYLALKLHSRVKSSLLRGLKHTTLTSGAAGAGSAFTWDGSGLGTGDHSLALSAVDALGNSDSVTITIRLEAEPPVVPPVVIVNTSRTATPTATSQSTGGVSLSPTARPTATGGTVTFGSVDSSGEAAAQAEGSPNLLWGAAAAGLIGAITAVVLDERRKRKEEEARQLAEAQAKAAALNAAEEQKRIQNWMNGNIALNQKLEELQKAGTSQDVIDVIKNLAAHSGLGTAINLVDLIETAGGDPNYVDNGYGRVSLHDLLLQQTTTDWGRTYGVYYAESGWNMLANAQTYYIWGANSHPGETASNMPLTDETLIEPYRSRVGNLTRIVCADVIRITYEDNGFDFHYEEFDDWYRYRQFGVEASPHNSWVLRELINAQGNLSTLGEDTIPDIGDAVFSSGGEHVGLIIYLGSDQSTTLVLQTSSSQDRLNVMTLEEWCNALNAEYPPDEANPFPNSITYGHVDGTDPLPND